MVDAKITEMTMQLRRVRLSPTDLTVLQQLADGSQLQAAARKLNLSPGTLRNRMAVVREEPGAANTTHAVALAIRAKLID